MKQKDNSKRSSSSNNNNRKTMPETRSKKRKLDAEKILSNDIKVDINDKKKAKEDNNTDEDDNGDASDDSPPRKMAKKSSTKSKSKTKSKIVNFDDDNDNNNLKKAPTKSSTKRKILAKTESKLRPLLKKKKTSSKSSDAKDDVEDTELKNNEKALKLGSHQIELCQKMSIYEQRNLVESYKDNKVNIGIIGCQISFGKTVAALNYVNENPTVLPNYSKIVYDILVRFPRELIDIIADYANSDRDCFKNACNFLYPRLYINAESFFTVNLELDNDMKIFSGNADAVINDPLSYTTLNCNIFVVSHTLFKTTWKYDADRFFPNMDVYYIHHKNTTPINREAMKHAVIICNANKYNELAKFLNKERLIVQRVIFDEIIDIDIKNCSAIPARFYYGITASVGNLKAIRNNGFIRNTFRGLEDNCLDAITIIVNKLDPKWGQDVKPFFKRIVNCACDADHQIINAVYPETALVNFLNEEMRDSAKLYLIKSLTYEKITRLSGDLSPEILELIKHSLLELCIMLIRINNVFSAITRHKRYYRILHGLCDKQICVRCCENMVGIKTKHLTCCGISYCTNCAQELTACPGCNDATVLGVNLVNDVGLKLAEKSLHSRFIEINRLRLLQNLRPLTKSEILETNQKKSIEYECDLDDLEDEIDDNDLDQYDVIASSAVKKAKKAKSKKQLRLEQERLQQQQRQQRLEQGLKLIEDCIIQDSKIPAGVLTKRQAVMEILARHHKSSTLSLTSSSSSSNSSSSSSKDYEPSTSDVENKTLIFINNIKMAAILSEMLNTAGLKHKVVGGNSGAINNIKKEFEQGDINILILQGKRAGSGLNFQAANVVIIYDLPTEQAETQAFGRAQRNGRKDQLIAYVLSHHRQ